MAAGIVAFSGCASSPARNLDAAQAAGKPIHTATADPDYLVGAGDVLLVQRDSRQPPERVVVRADGKIQFALGDPIHVDGLTSRQIAQALRSELGGEYRGCSVKIAECRSQVVHVFGTDAGDGAKEVPYTGKETVDELLRRIGCGDCQRGYRVRVVRRGSDVDDETQIFAVQTDRNQYLRHPFARPVYLEPNDFVYVERDVGKPGALTRMTETPWYRKPFQWFRRSESQDPVGPASSHVNGRETRGADPGSVPPAIAARSRR